MWCGQCNRDLTECKCKDLNDRMRDASNSPHFAAKWCIKCDSYYLRCKCKEPEWGIRTGGEILETEILN